MVTMHMKKVIGKLEKEYAETCSRYGWPKDITNEKYKNAVSQS